jgi:hypothetical protein
MCAWADYVLQGQLRLWSGQLSVQMVQSAPLLTASLLCTYMSIESIPAPMPVPNNIHSKSISTPTGHINELVMIPLLLYLYRNGLAHTDRATWPIAVPFHTFLHYRCALRCQYNPSTT